MNLETINQGLKEQGVAVLGELDLRFDRELKASAILGLKQLHNGVLILEPNLQDKRLYDALPDAVALGIDTPFLCKTAEFFRKQFQKAIRQVTRNGLEQYKAEFYPLQVDMPYYTHKPEGPQIDYVEEFKKLFGEIYPGVDLGIGQPVNIRYPQGLKIATEDWQIMAPQAIGNYLRLSEHHNAVWSALYHAGMITQTPNEETFYNYKSGRVGRWFVNLRQLHESEEARNKMLEFYKDYIEYLMKQEGVVRDDVLIMGVATGFLKFPRLVAESLSIKYARTAKNEKGVITIPSEYENDVKNAKLIIVLEDVLNHGTSAKEIYKEMRRLGAHKKYHIVYAISRANTVPAQPKGKVHALAIKFMPTYTKEEARELVKKRSGGEQEAIFIDPPKNG